MYYGSTQYGICTTHVHVYFLIHICLLRSEASLANSVQSPEQGKVAQADAKVPEDRKGQGNCMMNCMIGPLLESLVTIIAKSGHMLVKI